MNGRRIPRGELERRPWFVLASYPLALGAVLGLWTEEAAGQWLRRTSTRPVRETLR